MIVWHTINIYVGAVQYVADTGKNIDLIDLNKKNRFIIVFFSRPKRSCRPPLQHYFYYVTTRRTHTQYIIYIIYLIDRRRISLYFILYHRNINIIILLVLLLLILRFRHYRRMQVMWKRCASKNYVTCAKLALVHLVDRLERANDSYSLVSGVTVSSHKLVGRTEDGDGDVLAQTTASRDSSEAFDRLLVDKLGRYFSTLTLNVKLLDDATVQSVRKLGEAAADVSIQSGMQFDFSYFICKQFINMFFRSEILKSYERNFAVFYTIYILSLF